jgi:hypothetical protein
MILRFKLATVREIQALAPMASDQYEGGESFQLNADW